MKIEWKKRWNSLENGVLWWYLDYTKKKEEKEKDLDIREGRFTWERRRRNEKEEEEGNGDEGDVEEMGIGEKVSDFGY